jgi:hypothetical protein
MRMTPALRPRALAWQAPLRAAAIALALAALPAALTSCIVTPTSQIEQGQAISTGNEAYDAFLQAVRATREEAIKAEAQAADARAELCRSLGLEQGASAAATLEAARARAAKLREGGVLLHLQITPEVKLIRASGRAKIDDADQGVLTAVEESAKSSLAVSKQLSGLADRAAELEKKRSALEQETEAAFADASGARRRDVRRELEASARVLAEAANAGDKQAGLASKFVLDLAVAVETGAGAGPRAPAGRPSARPRGGGKPARTGAGTPTTKPAQPPKPKPAGGDDFEP